MKFRGWKIISIFLIPVQWLIFKIVASNHQWIEYNYNRGFFRIFSGLLRKVTSFFDFSLGLILVYILSAALLFALIRCFFLIKNKKRSFKELIINILAYFSPIYLLYMLSWGLAYHKMPIEELMNLNRENISNQEVINLCEALVDSVNNARNRLHENDIEKTTIENVFNKAPMGYEILSKCHSFLTYKYPSIKKAAGSTLLSYMSTSGVYMFPTGEANVNDLGMIYDLPFVTTHEMAHQLGFASEDEANFLAYLACKNHPEPLFRYSAYYGTTFRALSKVWEIDSTYSKRLFNLLTPQVRGDYEKEKNHWKRFRNPIQRYIVSPFYDLFLRSNGVEQGSRSYDLVIELLVAERRQKIDGKKQHRNFQKN